MSDEQISEIKELEDLRIKVLRGESVPPEEYHRVMLHVRKLRRDKKQAEPETPKQPLDIGKILFGKVGGT